MKSDKLHKIISVCTAICRFVLAIVFVFSGFVKAVDPLGTQYKIQDYISAFGMADVFPDFMFLFVAVSLGVLEFCLGLYLFFGIRKVVAPRLVLLLMSFMTPLTFWLALDNLVMDCGCFGDAIVLDNWETFWKNVVLLIMAIAVVKWQRYITPLVTARMDWLIGLYGFLYIIAISVYSYKELPIFDFRPYRVGIDIRKSMEIPEDQKPTKYETVFIMQRDGVEQEFTIDNYPDSSWVFVDSRLVVKEKGYEPPIQDFTILSWEDREDVTEQILSDDNYSFLLVAHQLSLTDDGNIDLVNELYDYCLQNGYAFYCLTASSDEDVEKWREHTGAEYPFCFMDDITLKTMIRSNPGLMLLKNGVIIRKWSNNSLPDEYQLAGPVETLPIGMQSHHSYGYMVIVVLAWFVFPLILISILDVMWKRFNERKNRLEKD